MKGEKGYHNATPRIYKYGISVQQTRQQTIQNQRILTKVIPKFIPNAPLRPNISDKRSSNMFNKTFISDNSNTMSSSSSEKNNSSSSPNNNLTSHGRCGVSMHPIRLFQFKDNNNNSHDAITSNLKERHITFASPIAQCQRFSPGESASSVHHKISYTNCGNYKLKNIK